MAGSSNVVETLMRAVGDLDHPVYADEHHRFVWYEASTIGFQIATLGSLYFGGAMLWFGPADARGWVVAGLFAMGLNSAVVQAYAKRHRAEYAVRARDFVRPRGVLVPLGGVVFISGFLLGADPEWVSPSLRSGLAVGVATGLVVVVLGMVLDRRRIAAREAKESERDVE